jgi:F0F1-type ATP synthase assembly protein I
LLVCSRAEGEGEMTEPLQREYRSSTAKGVDMLSALIGVLIIVVVGAICFWAIDKFAVDRRLAQLLKLLVVLICIAAILQRVLPLLGVYI